MWFFTNPYRFKCLYFINNLKLLKNIIKNSLILFFTINLLRQNQFLTRCYTAKEDSNHEHTVQIKHFHFSQFSQHFYNRIQQQSKHYDSICRKSLFTLFHFLKIKQCFSVLFQSDSIHINYNKQTNIDFDLKLATEAEAETVKLIRTGIWNWLKRFINIDQNFMQFQTHWYTNQLI